MRTDGDRQSRSTSIICQNAQQYRLTKRVHHRSALGNDWNLERKKKNIHTRNDYSNKRWGTCDARELWRNENPTNANNEHSSAHAKKWTRANERSKQNETNNSGVDKQRRDDYARQYIRQWKKLLFSLRFDLHLRFTLSDHYHIVTKIAWSGETQTASGAHQRRAQQRSRAPAPAAATVFYSYKINCYKRSVRPHECNRHTLY